MKNRNLWKSLTGLVFALAMIITAFVVVSPEAVKATTVAAPEQAFAGKGSSSVTIPDEQCTSVTNNYTWISFKPKKTGYITVTASNASAVLNYTGGYITFCDGSKKPLAQVDEGFTTQQDDKKFYQMTYGVKGGKTYYFRVDSFAGMTLKADVKAQKKAAGTKKSKAKELKKNKAAKGVIIAGDKTVDWYKIKLTKSQQLKLSYTTKSNGDTQYSGIKVTFCKSNGQPFTYDAADTVNRLYYPKGWTKFFMKNSRTGAKSGLKPGTYYVKVERYNTSSSGYYTLKWK